MEIKTIFIVVLTGEDDVIPLVAYSERKTAEEYKDRTKKFFKSTSICFELEIWPVEFRSQ